MADESRPGDVPDDASDQEYSEALRDVIEGPDRKLEEDINAELDRFDKDDEGEVDEGDKGGEAPPEKEEKPEPKYLTEESLDARLGAFGTMIQRAVQSENDKLVSRVHRMVGGGKSTNPWENVVAAMCRDAGVDPSDPRVDKGYGSKTFEESITRLQASISVIAGENAAAPTYKEEEKPEQKPEEKPEDKKDEKPDEKVNKPTGNVPRRAGGGGNAAMTQKRLDDALAKGKITWQTWAERTEKLGHRV